MAANGALLRSCIGYAGHRELEDVALGIHEKPRAIRELDQNFRVAVPDYGADRTSPQQQRGTVSLFG